MTAINYRNMTADIFYTLLAVAIIPSVIFLIIDQFWFIDRAIFNIDYMAMCLILIPFGAVAVAVGIASTLVLDIVFSFAPAYHFSLPSVLYSIRDMFSLEPGFLVAESGKVIALVLLGTISIYLSIKNTHSKRIVMTTCIFSAIVLTGLDIKFSANAIVDRDTISLNTNIAASSINNLRLAINTADLSAQNQRFQLSENASQDLRVPHAIKNEEFQTIILIVVESLGEFSDRVLNDLQMAPILALENQAGIVINSGKMAFEGSTVPGELRELCGIKLLAVHPDTSILPIEDCLPKVLNGAGYRTFAIHGFIGTLFSRNRWYPALGFDDVWFAPEIDEQIYKANRCGIAFHGICDVDIWKMIVALNSSEYESKNFIYWLTLSAHLPVEHPKHSNSLTCSNYKSLAQNTELCDLVLRHRQLFSEIALSVKRAELDNTRIILVGDHAPPFINNDTRSLFSSKYVPYVDIKINSGRGSVD